MPSKFSLDGGMIPRSVKRMFDERAEERFEANAQTATMEFRGRKHVVRLVNTSPSGAMVIFSLVPHIGEQVSLQLLEQGRLSARVRWVRDGRIGIAHLLKAAGLVDSTSEAIRLIQQGGVKVDGERIDDRSIMIAVGGEHIVQVGRRRFARVAVE